MTSGLDATEEKNCEGLPTGTAITEGGAAIRGRRPWLEERGPREYWKRKGEKEGIDKD